MTYGCHNHHERSSVQRVQIGWTDQGARVMVNIHSNGDDTCRYDLNQTDAKCAGCKWATAPVVAPEEAAA